MIAGADCGFPAGRSDHESTGSLVAFWSLMVFHELAVAWWVFVEAAT